MIKEGLQKINNGYDNNVDDKNGDDKNGDELGGSGEVIGSSEQTNESTDHELCDSRAPATKSKTSKRSMYNQ